MISTRSTLRVNRFARSSRSPKHAGACFGLMEENSTTRSNSALSSGLNPLERLAYYLVRLGTYSAKQAARAAKDTWKNNYRSEELLPWRPRGTLSGAV
jgi:hypothetical protein